MLPGIVKSRQEAATSLPSSLAASEQAGQLSGWQVPHSVCNSFGTSHDAGEMTMEPQEASSTDSSPFNKFFDEKQLSLQTQVGRLQQCK